MFVQFQILNVTPVVAIAEEKLTIVQDAELLYVGGGTGGAVLI